MRPAHLELAAIGRARSRGRERVPRRGTLTAAMAPEPKTGGGVSLGNPKVVAICQYVAGAIFFVLGAMKSGSDHQGWFFMLGGVFCASGFITSVRQRKVPAARR